MPFQPLLYPELTASPNHKVNGKLAEQTQQFIAAFAEFDDSIKVVPGKVFVDEQASVYQEIKVDFGQSSSQLFLRANAEDTKTQTRSIYAASSAKPLTLYPVVTAPYLAQLFDQILQKIVLWHTTELLSLELSKTFPKSAYTNQAAVGSKPVIDLDQTGKLYSIELKKIGDNYNLGIGSKAQVSVKAAGFPKAIAKLAKGIEQERSGELAWEEYDRQVTTVLMQYLTLHGIEAEMEDTGDALNIAIGELNTMAYCYEEEPEIFQLVIMMEKNKSHPRFGTTSKDMEKLGKLVSVMEGLTVAKAKAYIREHQAKQLADAPVPEMTSAMDLV